MVTRKKQYYAVVHGRQPGVYTSWYGDDGAADQVAGLSEAIFKGFYTREEMIDWLRQLGGEVLLQHAPDLLDLIAEGVGPQNLPNPSLVTGTDQVVIFADGGAINNPGPGGFGVVLKHKNRVKELSGGFRLTTNNRMEIMACIEGLRTLKKPCSVVIVSDSKYVVYNMVQGKVMQWQANGWKRTANSWAENADLWQQLLDLCAAHDVEFRWIRGHSGQTENERCHQLATGAMRQQNLPVDTGYEMRTTAAIGPLFAQ
jgi:ribonuclease HI